MTVFLVMESTGSYEDYRRNVDKVFSSREGAESYIAGQKRHWDDVKARLEKCRKCPFVWEMENVKNQDLFEKKALKYCSDAKFDWEHETAPCYLCLWDDEIPTWDIEEQEVNESN